jgi:hypothetical protein
MSSIVSAENGAGHHSSTLARLRSLGERLATLRTISSVAALTLPLVGLNLAFGPYARLIQSSLAEGLTLPDQQIGADVAATYGYFDAIGAAGRAQYVQGIWLDFITPLLLGVLTFSLLAALVRRLPTGHPLGWVLLLPIVTTLADWGENIGLLALLAAYPQQLRAVVALTGAFTTVKLLTIPLTFLAVLIGNTILLALWGHRRIERRQP